MADRAGDPLKKPNRRGRGRGPGTARKKRERRKRLEDRLNAPKGGADACVIKFRLYGDMGPKSILRAAYHWRVESSMRTRSLSTAQRSGVFLRDQSYQLVLISPQLPTLIARLLFRRHAYDVINESPLAILPQIEEDLEMDWGSD